MRIANAGWPHTIPVLDCEGILLVPREPRMAPASRLIFALPRERWRLASDG